MADEGVKDYEEILIDSVSISSFWIPAWFRITGDIWWATGVWWWSVIRWRIRQPTSIATAAAEQSIRQFGFVGQRNVLWTDRPEQRDAAAQACIRRVSLFVVAISCVVVFLYMSSICVSCFSVQKD